MDRRFPLIVRIVLGVFGVIDVATGLWAVLKPEKWFSDFPGAGRHWVAASGGPYNEHLVVDAGAGFLAVGVALVVAAVWMERRVVQCALAVLLAHSVPHFLHHVTSDATDKMSTFDKLNGVYSLGLQAVVAIAFLVLIARRPVRELYMR
ncbi:MAG TPA: hypothetical protein VM030_05405 [Acidimicrobiales bacterium]|nr:hypothetical protein [Acidimicrobiales bacterium]